MRHTYLFALADGGGTVPPELGAARRLVARGHRVTVLAEDSMADEVDASGARFVPWRAGPNRPDRDPVHDPIKDWEHRSPVAQVHGMADHVVAGPAPGQARDVRDLVIQERPDLVVASVFTIGAMIAAQGRGIPFDMLLPNVYPLPAEGIPPFGLGLRPARGPLGRVRDRVAHALMTGAVDRYTRDRLNAVRSEHGLAPLSHAWDQIRAARRQLVMTSPAFDFPGRLPSNARYVGPVLDDPAWAGSTGWSVPPGEAPLILVGLSSTFQDQVATLQRIVDGLATCPVRALVTTGPALDPSAVRGTDAVSVVGSAPHREVLPHARLVITHGGHGTLLKALAAGCPVVVLPHGRDQADNAVRVTERGAGVALSRRASAQDVARAVAKVLGDPSYARAAAALGAAVRHDAETSTLVAELEDLDERSPSGR